MIPDDLTDAIAESAQGPAQAEADGESARRHPLPDVIEADKYLAAKQAQAAGGTGLRFFRLIPPGTV